ncbi:MAG: ABC transporter ATP-binding protein, partial [Mesorhizobium sp.]
AGIRQIAHRVFTFRDGRIADVAINDQRARPADVSW